MSKNLLGESNEILQLALQVDKFLVGWVCFERTLYLAQLLFVLLDPVSRVED